MKTIFKRLKTCHVFSNQGLWAVYANKVHTNILNHKAFHIARDENVQNVEPTELSLAQIQWQFYQCKDDLSDARFIRTEEDLIAYIENDVMPTLLALSNLMSQKRVYIDEAIKRLNQPMLTELKQKINLRHVDHEYYQGLKFTCLGDHINNIDSIIDYALDVVTDK